MPSLICAIISMGSRNVERARQRSRAKPEASAMSGEIDHFPGKSMIQEHVL
jgi:hypothetical protein